MGCAVVCEQVPECAWWTYGSENEDQMCWLRTSSKGLHAVEDSSVGRRSCSPSAGGSWLRKLLGLAALLALASSAYHGRFSGGPKAVIAGLISDVQSLLNRFSHHLPHPWSRNHSQNGAASRGGGFTELGRLGMRMEKQDDLVLWRAEDAIDEIDDESAESLSLLGGRSLGRR